MHIIASNVIASTQPLFSDSVAQENELNRLPAQLLRMITLQPLHFPTVGDTDPLMGHLHSPFWRLVTVHDRTRRGADFDLLLLLNEDTAGAPVGITAVTRARAFDIKVLAHLRPFHPDLTEGEE